MKMLWLHLLVRDEELKVCFKLTFRRNIMFSGMEAIGLLGFPTPALATAHEMSF